MGRAKQPEETMALILKVSQQLFYDKGYDKTSIQDIMNETKLSKGGIYHHFKSKEAIFEAICEEIGVQNEIFLSAIRDDPKLNGLEKLNYIFNESFMRLDLHFLGQMHEYLQKNSKFIVMCLNEIAELSAPKYLLPIIEQGNQDGSLSIENPIEVAEAVLVLSNIWLNPTIFTLKSSSLIKRCEVINKFCRAYGFELIDKKTIDHILKFETIKLNEEI